MYRIFIAEDDQNIADALKTNLNSWGFEAKCAENFHDILPEISGFEPQLILLDISLPFYNGFYWCGEIRNLTKIPIVFISSASDNMNIVTAMNMGGDDFIAKPFDFNVLIAKIQAILRRTYDFCGVENTLRHNGAALDTNSAALIYNEQKIDLTKNEYRILQTLLEKKGTIVSREKLMNKLWETDSFIDENTLTVNIARLRKKLEKFGLENFIATKVGMGYMIGE